MNLTTFPVPYQSVFREACFTLDGVQAPGGLDIAICSPDLAEPLGVKRFYGTGRMTVNVAPYLRRLFSPEPLCGVAAGMHTATERTASCYIETEGFTSAAIALTCGTENAQPETLLSAAPATVKLRPGERDEMSLIASSDNVRAFVVFAHSGVEHSCGLHPGFSNGGMMTLVVDADAILSLIESETTIPASEIGEFGIELRMTTPMRDVVLRRRYLMDRTSKEGRRLAWLNRFGAVDYHTFPVVAETRVSGERTRIFTRDGYRTVATDAAASEIVLSEPCDAATAMWLAGIFSSPAVWRITGPEFERVEVSGGEVRSSPLQPQTVRVEVLPAGKSVSRKF